MDFILTNLSITFFILNTISTCIIDRNINHLIFRAWWLFPLLLYFWFLLSLSPSYLLAFCFTLFSSSFWFSFFRFSLRIHFNLFFQLFWNVLSFIWTLWTSHKFLILLLTLLSLLLSFLLLSLNLFHLHIIIVLKINLN